MFRTLFSALALLSGGTLLASNHPEPGSFGVTGEYLYLMPTVDDTYFVIDSPETTAFPNGTRENNNFGFNSGYRVGAVYAFCNCVRELEVSYAHLSANQSKTVSGDFLWATQGRADLASAFENYAGTAHSTLHLNYGRLDALFSQGVFNACRADIRVLFGLEYARLHFKENYTYESATALGTVSENSRTWGVGPQIGVEVDYGICKFDGCAPGTLSLNVLSSASLLTGQTKTQSNNVTPADTTILDVSDHKAWRVIPAFHARVGLGYEALVCGLGASLEVGYEFSSYFRGAARTTYQDDVADSLSLTNYNNFDVQGLYVSVGLSY